MSQLAIDPIGYSEALQKDGLPKAAADRIARSQEAMIKARVNELVQEKELATRGDLQRLKADLLVWIFGMLMVFSGVIISVLKM